MSPHYINFYQHEGEGWWNRRSFLHNWRRIYADDRRWLPPYYPALTNALQTGKSEHLDRMQPRPIYLEAMARSKPQPEREQSYQMTPHGMMGSLMEEPVAATVILSDPRRRDRSAYLALLKVVNNQESLERLLESVQESLWREGITRLLGPTGLTPHLQSGVLQDHFDQLPPLHTPYNPPYLPELMDRVMQPIQTTHLYHIDPSTAVSARPSADIEIQPLVMTALEPTLPSILAATSDAGNLFPDPDPAEMRFLIDWIGPTPLTAWIVRKNGQTVGAAIVQADGSSSFRRARGGANPLWRLWLNWRIKQPVNAGRLLWAGVLPAWRQQGIGQAIWHQLLTHARIMGWTKLTVGPLAQESSAASFLRNRGAVQKQRYVVYANTL